VLESLVVVGSVLLLGGMAALVASLSPLALVWTSAAVTALGCLLGIPGGIAYHVVLRRELLKRGALQRGWILRPIQQHAHLDDAALARIRPWFTSGALGFGLIMTGLALMTLTLLTHFR
jgi:hypothetical protein